MEMEFPFSHPDVMREDGEDIVSRCRMSGRRQRFGRRIRYPAWGSSRRKALSVPAIRQLPGTATSPGNPHWTAVIPPSLVRFTNHIPEEDLKTATSVLPSPS